MTLQQPLFMQPVTGDAAIDDTAQQFRQYVRAQLTAASGVGGEQGVTSASSLTVTQRGAGANMSVDIASGLAYIVGDDVTNQGTYQAWNDATVNVTGWTVPGSGTYHHRCILQIQDKLALPGTYSGYTAAFVPVLDTGGGLPAEPPSAITLATIDIPAASASITNSMINDYRQRVGPVSVDRTADLARTHATTMADDPVLQLLNLQASSQYALIGHLAYTGFNDVSSNQGSLTWTWRVSGGTTLSYTSPRIDASNTVTAGFGFTETGMPTANTKGTAPGNVMGAPLLGTIFTGNAPAYAVLQWAQNNDSGTATTMMAGSFLRAMRLS